MQQTAAQPPVSVATSASPAPGAAAGFALLLQGVALPAAAANAGTTGAKPPAATVRAVAQKPETNPRPATGAAPQAKRPAVVSVAADGTPGVPPEPVFLQPPIPQPQPPPAVPTSSDGRAGTGTAGAGPQVPSSGPAPAPVSAAPAQPGPVAKAAMPIAVPAAALPADAAPQGGQTAPATAAPAAAALAAAGIDAPRPIARTGPTTPTTTATPSPPAAQMQGVIWNLARSGGSQLVSVSLHPADLGRVEVRLDRDAAGGTQVSLLVERPETLHALVRDQAQLGQALDRAGVPSETRSISIQAAPPVQPDASPAAGGASLAGGGGGASGNGDGRRPASAASYDAEFAGQDDAPAGQPGTRWARAGIDITA